MDLEEIKKQGEIQAVLNAAGRAAKMAAQQLLRIHDMQCGQILPTDLIFESAENDTKLAKELIAEYKKLQNQQAKTSGL